MTPQEAREILNSIKGYYNDKEQDGYVGFDNEDNEALDMAIQALEQQPCDDAVSRQAVIEAISDWITEGEYNYTNATNYLVRRINALSSVTPQLKTGKWNYVIHYARRYRVYSECNAEKEDDRATGWNFCPNCGADMREVNTDGRDSN